MKTQIFQQVLKKDKDGNVISKMAILINTDTEQLQKDIYKYIGEVPCNLFIDIKLNNPWTYLIISGIGNLKYLTEEQRIRKQKLEKIYENERHENK